MLYTRLLRAAAILCIAASPAFAQQKPSDILTKCESGGNFCYGGFVERKDGIIFVIQARSYSKYDVTLNHLLQNKDYLTEVKRIVPLDLHNKAWWELSERYRKQLK